MIAPSCTYTTSEVAAWLHHSTRWFRAHRRRLESEGFPPPVSRFGHPRWSGADLLAWQNRDKQPLPDARPVSPGKVVDYERVLAERARALARHRGPESS